MYDGYLELLVNLQVFSPVNTQISKIKMEKFQEQSLRVFLTVPLAGVLTVVTVTYPG